MGETTVCFTNKVVIIIMKGLHVVTENQNHWRHVCTHGSVIINQLCSPIRNKCIKYATLLFPQTAIKSKASEFV